jgi:PleD family two-component response regulator
MLTLSSGIAAFGPGETTSAEELLQQADAALYRAKSAGRNQLALADGQAS